MITGCFIDSKKAEEFIVIKTKIGTIIWKVCKIRKIRN